MSMFSVNIVYENADKHRARLNFICGALAEQYQFSYPEAEEMRDSVIKQMSGIGNHGHWPVTKKIFSSNIRLIMQ